MRALLWVVGALGMLLALLCLVWFGYNFYVERFVSANPSTQEVIRVSEDEYRLGVYSGGDQVPPAPPEGRQRAMLFTVTPPAVSKPPPT